jgi:hypothetical protein
LPPHLDFLRGFNKGNSRITLFLLYLATFYPIINFLLSLSIPYISPKIRYSRIFLFFLPSLCKKLIWALKMPGITPELYLYSDQISYLGVIRQTISNCSSHVYPGSTGLGQTARNPRPITNGKQVGNLGFQLVC